MTERRAARRYELSLPISIRSSTGAKILEEKGTTRNVSTRGVYLHVDRRIAENHEFDLTMSLPLMDKAGADVLVRAIGKVVRVDEWTAGGDLRIGVAAVLRRYEIIRNEIAPLAGRRL
jgi:hypothetical protein